MFEIYGRNNCQSCENAKALLNSLNEEFVFYNIEENATHLDMFKMLFPERKTVPMVVFTDKDAVEWEIGGYEDLVKWLKPSTNE